MYHEVRNIIFIENDNNFPFSYLFNVNKRNNKTRHDIFSKFSIKTLECHSGVILMLTLNMFHSLFSYFLVNLEWLVVCLENSKKKQNKEATLLEEIFMQAIMKLGRAFLPPPPHPRAAPKRPILNKVNKDVKDILADY